MAAVEPTIYGKSIGDVEPGIAQAREFLTFTELYYLVNISNAGGLLNPR